MPDRTTIRQQIRIQRRSLNQTQRDRAAFEVDYLISNSRFFRTAGKIAFYLPHDGELDLTPLILRAWEMKKSVYLPILDTLTTKRLKFAPYHRNSPLSLNKFAIPEPITSKRRLVPAKNLDLILIPLVAFDRYGHRLGMGGGYYDRSLAFLKQRHFWHKPHIVGTAYEFQKIKNLSHQHWDIPLDTIVTEQQIHFPQK